MTRTEAYSVKSGDLVVYKDGEVRKAYNSYLEYDAAKKKGESCCTIGGIIENSGNYELYKRVGSNYKCPFKAGDRIMTNAFVGEDSYVKCFIKDGESLIIPGMHGTIVSISKCDENKITIKFDMACWRGRVPNDICVLHPNSLSFIDKLTPRVPIGTLEDTDELLLLC